MRNNKLNLLFMDNFPSFFILLLLFLDRIFTNNIYWRSFYTFWVEKVFFFITIDVQFQAIGKWNQDTKFQVSTTKTVAD